MQLSLFSRHHRRLQTRNAEREKRSAHSIELDLSATEHGGSLRIGRRKVERPVSTRRPMHVVLSSKRATRGWSMRKHERGVRAALRACAGRTGIKVYDFANVGSHLHLLLRARKRDAFQ